MKSLFLSAVLALSSLGMLLTTDSPAQARPRHGSSSGQQWNGSRSWGSTRYYYGPSRYYGGYYYPRYYYGSGYYSPRYYYSGSYYSDPYYYGNYDDDSYYDDDWDY